MSPEEIRADGCLNAVIAALGCGCYPNTKARKIIAVALRDFVLMERERCAKVADRYAEEANPEGNRHRHDHHSRVLGRPVASNVAAAIRESPQ